MPGAAFRASFQRIPVVSNFSTAVFKSESKFIPCTEDDAKDYCILLAKQFKFYARNKMISTKEAWIEFMKQENLTGLIMI